MDNLFIMYFYVCNKCQERSTRCHLIIYIFSYAYVHVRMFLCLSAKGGNVVSFGSPSMCA
jgi:hypothetical protein